MSWDVMIFKTDGITKADELPSDFKAESLGDAEELRNRLNELFRTIDWSDAKWGTYIGGGFSLEFNFRECGPVDSFMLHVRGGGDAISPIVVMCKHFGWRAFDCSTGEFLDLANPSFEGWVGFQRFRDKAIKRTIGEGN